VSILCPFFSAGQFFVAESFNPEQCNDLVCPSN
jgi:hypothetical protein